jgi:phosphoserine aminotransferase
MASATTPDVRPSNPNFSSGPCAKRPGFTLDALAGAFFGRSHRAAEPKARLAEIITLSRSILGMPDDWRLGIVPGSDTGAVEMALWSMLGARPVDIVTFESFGEGWATDIVKHLKLSDARVLSAPYGKLPDLASVDPAHDVVFAWNGTTSGVRVPNADWIAADRQGLAICDATSAAFAMALPWDKLDVVTWSWQKVLGGEAAHGMLALSPRAVERLETYTPPWPLPKVFRLTAKGKIAEGIFKGETINTPSMLCVEDAVDGLRWAQEPCRDRRLGRPQRLGRVPGRGPGGSVLHLGLPEDRGALVHRVASGRPGEGCETAGVAAGKARCSL